MELALFAAVNTSVGIIWSYLQVSADVSRLLRHCEYSSSASAELVVGSFRTAEKDAAMSLALLLDGRAGFEAGECGV